MEKGIVLFHQGYTDILNCLGLIPFYAEKYKHLIVLIRPEMFDCVEFFCNSFTNVTVQKDNTIFNSQLLNNALDKHTGATFLFHGIWDQFRNDTYKGTFNSHYIKTPEYFVQLFYTAYDIPAYIRFLSFTFTRDHAVEHSFYTKYNPTQKPYVLVHEDKARHILVQYPKTLLVIQLDKLTNIFFDSLMLLENANEIYCIDSVWSAFLYCVDMKYMFFCKKGIPITITCNRGYAHMYEPHLPNWTIISS